MSQTFEDGSRKAALVVLQSRPQWVCWCWEERKGKRTKVPYNPRSGQRAESNNAATWASYTLALSTWQKQPQRYAGIGYMFNKDITGIDLDHCVDAQGTLEPWAGAILQRLGSYAEYSPSATGVHILLSGTVARGIRRPVPSSWGASHPEAAIEMYSQGRYFTITGKHVAGTPTTLEARQDAIDALYADVVGARETNVAEGETKRPPAGAHPENLDDERLLQKATGAGNGEKFRALFYGGSAGYPSASEADMALCLLLAFWTGRDTERMDRLFRRSALYREKWDTSRSESTYGWETITRAAAHCQVVYDPERTRHQLERDVEQLLQQIAQQQGKLSSTRKRKPSRLTPKEVSTSAVLAYLDENEYGDARFFADVFAGQVCYDHTEKEWYLWDGHAWKRDATSKVRQLVAGILGTLYLRAAADLNTAQADIELQIQALQQQGMKETDAQLGTLKDTYKALAGQMNELRTRAKGLRSAKRMQNVLTFIQAEMGITSEIWDTNPWLLAVPNGVIDLHTGACRDGAPGDFVRTVAPTEWTGLETACPRFERFLQEIFADKEDRAVLIAFLQRLLGYGITGLSTHHIFPILYGEEGRNGKDTLLDTLKMVLGALVGAVSNDVFIAQDKTRSGGAATPHLCDLQGKRLVWGSETKEGDRLNIAQIKLLTGGGDISTRQLHGKQYTFTPTHKLWLMTNYKPHADARDKAFWVRACLIEFSIRFIDHPHATNERVVDPTLKETLKQERSGILAWLIRGCLAWQEQGLAIPESVQLATDKYRDEEDKLLLFIQECCLVTPSAWIKASALYTSYRTWYEANQFGGRSMNGKRFGEEMTKRFEKKRGKAGLIYQGVGLLSNDEQEPLFSDDAASVGTMQNEFAPSAHAQPASEANRQNSDGKTGVGYVGLYHVSPRNEQSPPSIGEKTWNNHTHPTPELSVTTHKPASEASLAQYDDAAVSCTDPTLEGHEQPCTTRWEKRRKVAHEAAATQRGAGFWWCEKCTPQCALMEYGHDRNYPRIHVPAHGGFTVQAGVEKWLQFAQEAGYALVQCALVVAQQQQQETTPTERGGDVQPEQDEEREVFTL